MIGLLTKTRRRTKTGSSSPPHHPGLTLSSPNYTRFLCDGDLLDLVDGLGGAVFHGHDQAPRVQDGVVVGPLQGLEPAVAPVIRDVHVRVHHGDGVANAACWG